MTAMTMKTSMLRTASAMTRARLATMWRPRRVFLTPWAATSMPGHDAGPVPRDGLVAGHEQALLAWRHWCERHAGSRCELSLSGHWLLTCAVTFSEAEAGASAASRAALVRTKAAEQWGRYHGLEAAQLDAGWVVRVLSREAGARLACAMPRTLLAALQGAARQHHVQLAWLGPWWARGAQTTLSHVLAKVPSAVSMPAGDETLSALEPGLATNLRVTTDATPGSAPVPQLATVWTEIMAPDSMPVRQASPGTGRQVVALPSPPTHAPVDAAPWHPWLWDHEAAAPVLQGRPDVWLEAA